MAAAGITALAPWFGSNRLLGKHVGEELAGCSWVGIPFAGGMSEVKYITARTILVNDLHRHVINLARVIANDKSRIELLKRLRRTAFHPDELAASQEYCRLFTPDGAHDLNAAQSYFVCCWMGRANKCGIDDQFNGRPAFRWNSNGGDSAVRFQSAVRSMVEFGRLLRRCGFETMDAFDFLYRSEDGPKHGYYMDPPFPEVGRRYQFNAGKTEADERAWHTRLRDAAERFQQARVVMRFYDHELIRELYPEPKWTWRFLKGRDQANGEKPEVLLINGPSRVDGKLF